MVIGVRPALGRGERRLPVSAVGGFGMPLEPIGRIVLCCVEDVIMEVKGERSYCSRPSSGHTETLLHWVTEAALWGQEGHTPGTQGPVCTLRLCRARAGLNFCSWTLFLLSDRSLLPTVTQHPNLN